MLHYDGTPITARFIIEAVAARKGAVGRTADAWRWNLRSIGEIRAAAERMADLAGEPTQLVAPAPAGAVVVGDHPVLDGDDRTHEVQPNAVVRVLRLERITEM